MDKIEKLISDLIIVLIQHPVRFVKAMGYRLAVMPRQFVGDNITQTMAVDGVTLFINPVWTSQQSKIKLLFVLLHEACHVWMLHSKRLRDAYPHQRDMVHQAADYVVNLTLEQARCPYPVPADALIDHKFVDRQGRCLNVERVMALLAQQEQKQQPLVCPIREDNGDDQEAATGSEDGDNGDAGGADDAQPGNESAGGDDQSAVGGDSGDDSAEAAGNGPSDQVTGGNGATPRDCGDLLPAPEDMDESEQVKRNEQALQLSVAGSGSMPANMLEELHKQAQGSDTDWLDLFRDRFATAVDASDYTFSRINAPYAMIGMVEPVLYAEALGTVAVVIDESSSMDNDMLNMAQEQLAKVVAEWTPQRLLIIRHTSNIVDVQDLSYGQEPEPRDKRAHGGTAFNPVIDMLEDECVEVACWVTDCMPCETVKDTQVPVIWLGTDEYAEDAHKRYNLQGDYVAIA